MAYNAAPDGWWQSFVSALPARTGKLAVVRADGSPHVAPVWVDLDGDELVFMTSADTIKGKSILRDGRVALCFDDERPPFSFVTVAGPTTTSTDPDELLHWATRIAARVHGCRARRGLRPPQRGTAGDARAGHAVEGHGRRRRRRLTSFADSVLAGDR